MNNRAPSEHSSGPSMRFLLLGFALAGLGSVAVLYQLVSVAVEKLRAGKGFETYRTVWLVEFSYVGVLILFAAVLLAAAVSAYFWWREEQLWRDFARKYRGDIDA
jgi:hypothetical protein